MKNLHLVRCYAVACWLCLLCAVSKAQNLIPNFSFEEYSRCPDDIYFGQVAWPIEAWFNVNSGTPDYYHRCSSGRVTIPRNWAGEAQTVHGDAYIGIYLWGLNDYREYVGVKLKEPLEAGVRYFFEGYYQQSFYSHFVTGSIGVLFSTEMRKGQLAARINAVPQIAVRKKDALSGEVFEWEKLSGSFVAAGGEQFLAIGNFDSSAETSKAEIEVNAQKEFQLLNRSYVYIDHLRLWKEGDEVPPDSAFQVPEIDKFILSDINFEFDSYQLRDTAAYALQPLLEHLKAQAPNSYVLLITGYTDDVGADDYNLRLSRNRARAVALYLLQNGIPRNLLKTFGRGELDPVAPNDTDLNRRQNRRVEIVVRDVNK
ncbi:MAG: OmpA family protein [Bacteroidota bacterium]